MIPSSFFIHVIEAERQHDLQVWQRAHAGRLSAPLRPRVGLVQRLRTALWSRGLTGPREVARDPHTEPLARGMACC
jgi:hypothetical protein